MPPIQKALQFMIARCGFLPFEESLKEVNVNYELIYHTEQNFW